MGIKRKILTHTHNFLNKVEKLCGQYHLPKRNNLTLPWALKFFLLGSPRGPLQPRNKLLPRGGQALMKAWFKDRNVWVLQLCSSMLGGFPSVHRCTWKSNMDMRNVFWIWKMSADDMFILHRWIQYRTIFCKETISTICYFFFFFWGATKWWHKKWIFPSYILHLFLGLTTVFHPECNHWLL